MARIPLVFVGDHPEVPTGLGRILGDLVRHTQATFADTFDVRVVGWAPWAGIPTSGVERELDLSDDHYRQLVPVTTWAFNDTQKNWGADALVHAYRQWFGSRDGFIFTVWDPGRCLPYAMVPLPVTKWGYFAIDAANVHGRIAGPAQEALRRYDRLLAYTEFGAEIIAKSTDDRYQPHLPHGIHTRVFQPHRTREDVARAQTILRVTEEGRMVIGCVATNQPRKDWGMVAHALKILVDAGHNVHAWWHTDRIVSEAWSLPQLAEDMGLTDRVTYTTSLGDDDLAKCYAACVATVAPGRGEGFGYPIVESYSCGTPVLHADYAGGAEVMLPGGLITPVLHHLVGPYALQRPILSPQVVADRLTALIQMPAPEMMALRASVRAYALKYDWAQVWPQFEAWIRKGIGQ